MPSTTPSPSARARADALRRELAALPFNANFTDAEAEGVYAKGYRDAQAGNHAAAFESFRIASMARPDNRKYLRALAVTHRECGDHEQALVTFHCLKVLHPGHRRDDLDIAETLLRLQRPEPALRILDTLLQGDTAATGDDAAVLERAAAIRDLLRKKAD